MPAAGRARRSFWIDPRFLVGLVLVAASVVAVSAVLASADRRVRVYAAREPLTAGMTLTGADLVEVLVSLEEGADRYVRADGRPLPGDTVLRPVGEGELVPVSAFGDRADVERTTVVVPLSASRPSDVERGDLVDVWAAAEEEDGRFGAPRVVAGAVPVTEVSSAEGFVAVEGGDTVEVSVPAARVAALLDSVANEDVLMVTASTGIGRAER